MTISSENINIGTILKAARKEKNLTQKQLAEKVGKKRSYISRLERNENETITLNTLFEIVEKGLEGKINIDIVI